MRTLEEQRASDARGKIAFLAGETDMHPHGWSGKRKIIPGELDQSGCWDTSPAGWKFSEWGRLSGADLDWHPRAMGGRNAA